MRFTWIALPVVLMTLAGTGTSDARPSANERSVRVSGTDRGASTSTLPVAAMPSNSGEARLARLSFEGKVRRGPPVGDVASSLDAAPGNLVRVRIRTVDHAGLQFIPELTRATLGFFFRQHDSLPASFEPLNSG
jgi:hypothetical protein